MIIKWIYNSWRYFWILVISLGVTFLFFGLILWALLQTDPVQRLLADSFENRFNEIYEGDLYIGNLSGRLPFQINLDDTYLVYNHNSTTDTLAFVERISVGISFQDLLRREVTINSVVINKPHFKFDIYEDGESNNFVNAFRSKNKPLEIDSVSVARKGAIEIPRLKVSRFVIVNGTGTVNLSKRKYDINLPDYFEFEDLNTSLSLELSPDQQFFNLSNFVVSTPQLINQNWQFRGQIYADERFFELNRITLRSTESIIRFNLEIDGFDLINENMTDQLKAARYRFRVSDMNVNPLEFTDLMPELALYELPINLELDAEGTYSEAVLNRLDLFFGESRALLNGTVQNPFNLDELGFSAELEFLNVHTNDLQTMNFLPSDFRFQELGDLTVRGFVNGDIREILTRWDIFTPSGEIAIDGTINLQAEDPAYNLDLKLKALDLSKYPSLSINRGLINGDLKLTGEGVDYQTATTTVVLDFNNSYFEEIEIEKLVLEGTIDEGFFEPSFNLSVGDGFINGSGWMDLLLEEPVLNFSGESRAFNISDVYQFEDIESSNFNFRYNLVTQGFTMDSFHGDFYFDFRDSELNNQTIDEFEFVFALSPPNTEERVLTIGGTWLELELSGNIIPSNIIDSYDYWFWQTKKLISEKTIYLDELPQLQVLNKNHNFDLNLKLNAQIDNLITLNQFFNDIPAIDTITNIDIGYSADAEKFEISGNIHSDFFSLDDIRADSISIEIYSSIRKDRTFGFHESIFDVTAKSFESAGFSTRDSRVRLNMYDEAVVLEEFEGSFGDDVKVGAQMTGVFTERGADIRILDFFVGDESYNWQNISETPIIIDSTGHVRFNNLEFGNLGERIIVDGVISEQEEDALIVEMKDFQLQKISDIINGQISFAGRLNGLFTASTLRTNPFLSGQVSTREFTLDGRMIGDITFESDYDNLNDLFNLKINILTDPRIYAEYLETNRDVGQDINIAGFVKPGTGDENLEAEFDIDFREIDLWILPYIVEDVFTELEGSASGNGKVTFSNSELGYDATFTITDVALRPVFLNSLLVLNGDVMLNDRDGVVLNRIQISDNSGGTGVLSGTIDLNDFQPEKFLDLQLSMNRLRFIDNSYDPDSPFYGRAFGTGTIRMSGTNFSPFLSTPEPISLTSNSVLSILAEEDGFTQEAIRFIEFVDSFDEPSREITEETIANGGSDVDLTFIEQFQLDLRFVANQNMTVRLVFDNVTNEVLTARGTGNIRLLLQDQEFQVFGRFDISGGDYNFVGGDIFSRRFTIRDGGNISWDGDPVNARLNVLASYRARPDIRPLRPDLADNQVQRTIVDLILEITGTLDSIENDFFFEVPSGADASQTAAILGIINSEEQKLLQATTILFTNSFYPVDTDTRDAGTFQSRAGQVGLGTLLSAQINTLLNSNVSNLDIDLNLTGFDQADLGIALRLFDDRLTLRREGLITGEDANLGDFDVTFQLNRYLSLQAFHRRDPFLSGLATASRGQFETVNGIGLDARIQFNTWNELGRRINPFRRSVSVNRNNEENE